MTNQQRLCAKYPGAAYLSQVEYAPKPDSANIFSFYMGRNTPERKDYIMDNLVVPVEE